ncbi:leucyl/phenylalanyl-tRNA--protein transferase [Marinivivus vitaminiproducens]|uniref:leucyl/phenylalanyl-tRNA--protein transferase n=1 Tax=Marinivivus vitaminiproducens TaxID=3035935 RepID=UPI002798042C|nr:leucyl/phenylalanyl-tRNA--protein transferase [Geminicoccaceae bacterium SCSIO 64248]
MIVTLTPELALRAYQLGLFPMARDRDDPTIQWIEPRQRGILPLDGFHVPRSLRKALRRAPFEVRVDTAFRAVIEACAEPGPDRERTWINDELIELYVGLFEAGYGHSVECWADQRLVGGLYGVSLGGAFFGESMFSRVTDASKIALVHLVERLRVGSYVLLDIQFVNDHLRQFGAIEIPRSIYRARLAEALMRDGSFRRFDRLAQPAGASSRQVSTQTS